MRATKAKEAKEEMEEKEAEESKMWFSTLCVNESTVKNHSIMVHTNASECKIRDFFLPVQTYFLVNVKQIIFFWQVKKNKE